MNDRNKYIKSLTPVKSNFLLRTTKSIDLIKKLISEQAEIYIIKGREKLNLKNFKGAIEDFSKAIDFKSNDAELYFIRANAKKDKFEEYYTNRKGYSEKEWANKEQRTKKYHDKIREVLIDYDQAIKLNPNNINYFISRGLFWLSLDFHQPAIEDFNKAIRMNPNDASLYIHRGEAKLRSGYTIPKKDSKLNDALEDFNKGIDLNPNIAEFFFIRGSAKDEQHDYLGALEDYTKAIKLNPKHYRYFERKGWLEHRIENYEAAFDDFEMAIKLGTPTLQITTMRDGLKEELLKNSKK